MTSRQAAVSRETRCYGTLGLLTVVAAVVGCSGTATPATNGGAGTVATGGAANAGGTAARLTGGNSGAGGSATGGASTGSASGGGGATSVGRACTNPVLILPASPSNPHGGITLDGYYVDTDAWNAANYQVSETVYICEFNNWYVVANMNNDNGDGAVKTYPNVHKDFNSAPQLSSFSTITSSFAHTAPHVGIYEFAYDIWLNGVATSTSTEVMIWTDNFNQVPSGSLMDTVTFDAASYQVYKTGSYIAFVATTNVTAGTLNLLSFFNYVIGKGWIPASSTLGAIDYGVELVSTNGSDATFAVTDFSVTTT